MHDVNSSVSLPGNPFAKDKEKKEVEGSPENKRRKMGRMETGRSLLDIRAVEVSVLYSTFSVL